MGGMCISSFFHPLLVLWKSGFSELGSHSIALPIVLRSHGVVSSAQPWWARESLILEPSLWLEHFDMPHKIPLPPPPSLPSTQDCWCQNYDKSASNVKPELVVTVYADCAIYQTAILNVGEKKDRKVYSLINTALLGGLGIDSAERYTVCL